MLNSREKGYLNSEVDVKKGDRFKLSCGHEGRVVWTSSDHQMICVRGVSKYCQICGKKSTGGWVPTNHLITLRKAKG